MRRGRRPRASAAPAAASAPPIVPPVVLEFVDRAVAGGVSTRTRSRVSARNALQQHAADFALSERGSRTRARSAAAAAAADAATNAADGAEVEGDDAFAELSTIRVRIPSNIRGLDGLVISLPAWEIVDDPAGDDASSRDWLYQTDDFALDVDLDIDVDPWNVAFVQDADLERARDPPPSRFDPSTLSHFVMKTRYLPEYECSICLEPFRIRQHCRLLGCNHTFHKRCIDRWLRRTAQCPMCRVRVAIVSTRDPDDATDAAGAGDPGADGAGLGDAHPSARDE